ncbi:MAG: hypothetical protein LVQ95_04965 [Candidatus Micrarchaeales archaeon]|nr:hypothetical protein [Candidatus Micrarchaeales archaeon]
MNSPELIVLFIIGIAILFMVYSIARRNKVTMLLVLLVLAVVIYYVFTNPGSTSFLSSFQP